MDDLSINITVEGGSEQQTATGEAGNETTQAKGNAKVAFTVEEAARVARQYATKISSGIISSIGARTGNTVLQDQIQLTIDLGSKGVGVATAFIANPYLGLAALVGEGIGTAFDIAAAKRQIAWTNRQNAENARRAGYLSSRNR